MNTLVALIVGGSVARIAFSQMRIAHSQMQIAQEKLKADLFDRNFPIFLAHAHMLDTVLHGGSRDPKVSNDAIRAAARSTIPAIFLLGKDMTGYLALLVMKSQRLSQSQNRPQRAIDNLSDADLQKKIDEQHELTDFIYANQSALEDAFKRFLPPKLGQAPRRGS